MSQAILQFVLYGSIPVLLAWVVIRSSDRRERSAQRALYEQVVNERGG